MRTKELFDFIYERHQIYVRRFEQKKPKPWTRDKILQRYRFCNVYRELDTVTQWIAQHWRYPNRKDPYLFFAMAVARVVNWPDSLDDLGYPVPWHPQHFVQNLNIRKASGKKVFTGAYLVSTNGMKISSKPKYLADYVLSPLWKTRHKVRDVIEGACSLNVLHCVLTEYNGLGSFIAAQIIADLKYVGPLVNASDWWTWAAPGPGSLRGLNRVCGYAVDAPWGNNGHWEQTLKDLQDDITPYVNNAGMPRLHAQDLQNCLCEFDKYERVRLGEGRPRSLYPGV